MRIVSLLGSATEIVCALGLEEHLVGISHECDYPPGITGLPRVSRSRFDPKGLSSAEIDSSVRRCMAEFGSVYTVDRNLLESLRPTHILTQGLCEVCAVPVGSVEDAIATLPGPVEVLSLDAHSVGDILITIQRVADSAGHRDRGEQIVAGLAERLGRATATVASEPAVSVLLLEWLDPLFTPGHWVPEMIALAGGNCLAGSPGARSIVIEPGAVEALNPDILLIEPCGLDIEETFIEADRHLDFLNRVIRKNDKSIEAWVLHSAWFSRSGPRVVEGVELLARILHPHAFPDVALDGRAKRWQ